MNNRITRKHLDFCIERLNKALGRPPEPYVNIAGQYVAQIGNFHLDHNIGGWQIQEMDNASGGVKCSLGCHRGTAAELCRILDAAIAGVELARKQKAMV